MLISSPSLLRIPEPFNLQEWHGHLARVLARVAINSRQESDARAYPKYRAFGIMTFALSDLSAADRQECLPLLNARENYRQFLPAPDFAASRGPHRRALCSGMVGLPRVTTPTCRCLASL